MIDILNKEGISFKIQKRVSRRFLITEPPTYNIIVELGDRTKADTIVIGAHYDAWMDSIGINDNAVAVATLVELCKNLKDTKEKIDIVFFDKEETGFLGSSTYIEQGNKHNIKYAYVLDIIGFGDTPIITGATTEALENIDSLETLISYNNILGIRSSLPSDNIIFKDHGIPSVLIVSVPGKDLVEKEDGSLGFVPAPVFYSSFHNRANDNKIEVINWELPEIILNDLTKLFMEAN